ncbi:Glycosyltransferase involved in cell wall bisynthesis [Mucilaginibacter mallensis]|uniref:Glycosyltransferase involved in cell wall bisynthesis n=1 Tax=Mucilaginibacter mallensis TaxID=652787 RepID=A0A1H1YMT9_MUCMA|nr:glycosyltransferase family 2 protein [Mucilaginibacter mallensis]SDT22695.1 Glycosyltransferase involved in cell wall bisynthesis [Mucilaginibacter mallensis]
MAEFKISVAMTTYNGEMYLQQQIDSIINQTYSPDEIIVSDDCSTDGTKEILKEYQAKGLIIYLTNNGKNGVVPNFKNAVKHCKKDNFIALADQDDIWLPEKLETALTQLKKIDINIPALVFSDLNVIDGDNKTINQSFFKEIVKVDPQFEQLRSLMYSNKVIGCATLFNPCMRNYFDSMPNDVFMHDYWIALIAFTFGQHVYINQPLIKYRRHNNNVTSANDAVYHKFIKELLDYLLNRKVDLDNHIKTLKLFYNLYQQNLTVLQTIEINKFIDLQNHSTFIKRMQTFRYKKAKP